MSEGDGRCGYRSAPCYGSGPEAGCRKGGGSSLNRHRAVCICTGVRLLSSPSRPNPFAMLAEFCWTMSAVAVAGPFLQGLLQSWRRHVGRFLGTANSTYPLRPTEKSTARESRRGLALSRSLHDVGSAVASVQNCPKYIVAVNVNEALCELAALHAVPRSLGARACLEISMCRRVRSPYAHAQGQTTATTVHGYFNSRRTKTCSAPFVASCCCQTVGQRIVLTHV